MKKDKYNYRSGPCLCTGRYTWMNINGWTDAWIGEQMDWWMDKQIKTYREADLQAGEMG
jgi:hypothetical protein